MKTSNSENPHIDDAVDYVGRAGKNFTSFFLKTQRDVVRFCNSLLLDIAYIKNDVNFIDFYLLQLMKLKHFKVYRYIAEHREIIFFQEGDIIRLRKTSELTVDENSLEHQILSQEKNNRGTYDRSSMKGKDDETILEKKLKSFPRDELNELDVFILMELINELLNEKEIGHTTPWSKQKNTDIKSFVYWDNFHKYFNIELLETDFPIAEFEKLRNGEFDQYRNSVLKWMEAGKESRLLECLERITQFDSATQWENHLKILIEITRQFLDRRYKNNINYSNIVKIMDYPLLGGKIKFFKDKSHYRQYIDSIFNNASDPYVLESNILSIALNDSSFVLNNDEIESRELEYLRAYCANHNEVTSEFRNLSANCEHFKNPTNKALAHDIFVKYFREHLQADELGGFIRQNSPRSDNFIIETEWFNTFYSDRHDFINAIESARLRENAAALKEFIDFYTLYQNGGAKPIPYGFQYLKPQMWQ